MAKLQPDMRFNNAEAHRGLNPAECSCASVRRCQVSYESIYIYGRMGAARIRLGRIYLCYLIKTSEKSKPLGPTSFLNSKSKFLLLGLGATCVVCRDAK